MPSEQLSILVEKYLTESLQPEEHRQLAAMLQDPQHAEAFQALVLRDLAERRHELEPDERIGQEIRQYVQAHLTEEQAPVYALNEPVHRIPPLRKWGWVAALLLPMGLATYLWLGHRTAPSDQAQLSVKADIAPGSERAVLTLSDGTQIVLDSAGNGTLAQQGNAQIVKLANGQIAYHADGKASDALLMNTMYTPKGGQYQLTLPDGTHVWLNAASSITYPAAFTGANRKVKITGEAYFEVKDNKSKPFIVDVDGRSSVEVLGTHFNVNSYTSEKSMKTTLLEGSVRILNAHTAAVLRPGQQAAIEEQATAVKVSTDIDIEQVVAWKNGFFNLQHADFTEVMGQLERWYDIEVRYEGKVTNIQFEGEINRSAPLSAVLKWFEKLGIHSRLEGRILTINGS